MFSLLERRTGAALLAAGTPQLAATGVSLRAAGGQVIVNDISLAVAAGEKLAIVGPNGAGKTSLLRLLYGRLPPDRGQVSFAGRDLRTVPLLERARHIAVVGQSDRPDQRLRLADYVDLGRIPHRGLVGASRHREVVAAALAAVGLGRLAGRTMGTLSGGERQRAAIARALAQQPEVLILDEPTNHLDPRARADILDLARSLPITVVAVLHDLALVTPFADRVAVLRAGNLVRHDIPALALSQPVVREVFEMDSFAVTNPANGRSLLVFDRPAA
jgi:iron complex transport system ATP-binding protein